MTTLYMMIGIPGSGKSTYINKIKNENTYVASTDNYIERIAASKNKTYNDMFIQLSKDAEASMKHGILNAVKKGMDICWDQTNLTVKTRARKLKMIPDHYIKIAVLVKTPPLEELNRRLGSRPGKTIPEFVIKDMMQKLQYPTVDEGFNQVIVV